MIKLNFTMTEALRSDTANKLGINNMPTDSKILDNILNLYTYVMQPLRDYVKRKIFVYSCYRCPKLNEKVGGKSNSQHLSGCAIDFVIDGLTIDQAIQTIMKSGVEYDQLIHEGTWVHLSFVTDRRNRKQYIKV